jgi:hypothetical protein
LNKSDLRYFQIFPPRVSNDQCYFMQAAQEGVRESPKEASLFAEALQLAVTAEDIIMLGWARPEQAADLGRALAAPNFSDPRLPSPVHLKPQHQPQPQPQALALALPQQQQQHLDGREEAPAGPDSDELLNNVSKTSSPLDVSRPGHL